jgi:mono/diheme cytochrome c family protein
MKALITRQALVRILWLLVLGTGAFVVYAWRSPLAPVDPPAAGSFDAQVLARGAQLAALGDCATCHTAPGGDAFAGGRPVLTPFGTVYSTNITPNVNTGIGHWSLAAFQRAFHEGVNRAGEHLYPAFPYDHFTLLSDTDTAALYAFIMTRQPVEAHTPESHLPFPLNVRMILAGWKLVFLHAGPYRKNTAHDEQWNRGAYLAEGIGHCGACHTPRNSLGAQIGNQHLSGGEAEGWHAFAINSRAQPWVPWDADALYAYLRNGWHEQHGAAYGPMAPVVQALASVGDADVRAIAVYVAASMSQGRRATPASTSPTHAAADADPPSNEAGAAIYATSCASCHDGTRPLPFGGVKLMLSTAVTGETATNLVRIILEGLHPPEGTAGPMMPGFSSSLTDGQLESLVAYLRSNIGSRAPWSDVEATVREARSRTSD